MNESRLAAIQKTFRCKGWDGEKLIVQGTAILHHNNLCRATFYTFRGRWEVCELVWNDSIFKQLSPGPIEDFPTMGLHRLSFTEKQFDYLCDQLEPANPNQKEILAYYHYSNRHRFEKPVKPEMMVVTNQTLANGKVSHYAKYRVNLG